MIQRRDIVVGLTAVLLTLSVVAATGQTSVMQSTVFDWNSIAVKQTDVGAVRQFFRTPTITLDELECHVTTLNPGESPHAPHQHPEEELMIVKEGTIDVMQNGVTKRAGPGSVVFQASNEMHGFRNVGQTQATYHVIKWYSPGTLKPKP